MKKTIFTWYSIILLLFGCKINETPEYQRMDNFKITKLGLKNIELKADAVFNNPNIIGITVKRSDIDVFNDSILLGKATTPTFDVNKESEFNVPLTVHFSPKKVLKQKGSLGSIISAISGKELNVTYKGSITLDVLGIEYDYDFAHTQTVNLKKEE